ncbi:cytochrome c oxidase assembly protein [Virgibacillus siamensis]|uniref:cytochrome c oxidase assembly protein n=1 Tax=Virgibacillus siamensis TaxID=480071 RepID=UPI0009872C2F|nr:cytochrome c oxidase assembly protein [Virgibacillus siamensis]
MQLDVLLINQSVWNLPLFMGLVCIFVLYILALKRYTDINIVHKQSLLFFLGLGLCYITTGSPIAAISHLSFSTHMLQMSILFFIIPPLLILGIPGQLSKVPAMKGFNKLFLPPVISLYAFGILFLMYHLPVFLNIFSQHTLLHNGYMLLLFILSSMWRPITVHDPRHRLYGRQKKRYAIRSGMILMPACLIFILNAFTDGIQNPFLTEITAHLCTPSQIDSAKLLPLPFNTNFDQIMAGTLMMGMHKFSIMLAFRLGK